MSTSFPFLTLSNTSLILSISLILHLLLIAYGEYQDSHFVVKYTDVDYRVFSDAVNLIWRRGDAGNEWRAKGWLVQKYGLNIGDPYERSTFRYTPLLPLLLSPLTIHPLLGKLILSFFNLLIPLILLSPPISAPSTATHLIWTLNPMILNITTRGSSEAILGVFVLWTLRLIKCKGTKAELGAAVVWSLSVGWKLYPIVFGASILMVLDGKDKEEDIVNRKIVGNGMKGFLRRLLRWRKIRFGLVSAVSFGIVNGICWSFWGYPFLHHTYLYHLHRLDHRHNFSPYFYPIYLRLFQSQSQFPSTNNLNEVDLLELLLKIARHPLSSFIPQISLSFMAGFLLTPTLGVEMAWFCQTWVFVMFNKVCTSQYFTWYLFFLPPLIPHLEMTATKSVALGVVWVGTQALWLSLAYRLEFLAQNVFLPLWFAGIIFLIGQGWVLIELLRSHKPITARKRKVVVESGRKVDVKGKDKVLEQVQVAAPSTLASNVREEKMEPYVVDDRQTASTVDNVFIDTAKKKKFQHGKKLAD